MRAAQNNILNIKSSKLMNSLFIWNFKATFSWKGIEFQDFREYSYSDDSRYIDWSVSSREQRTIMRRYREEKQGNILSVVDARESLEFGENEKKEIYSNVLDLLYLASKSSNENFWGYILDNNTQTYIPPQKSIVTLHKLKQLSHAYKSLNDSLSLDFIMSNRIKRSVIFVISDNMSLDIKSFKIAAMKHDIVFVHVSSHFENTLQWTGISRLKWLSKGYNINLDNESKRVKYIKARKNKLSTFSRELKKIGIDSIFLDEKTSIYSEFLRLMKQREKSN